MKIEISEELAGRIQRMVDSGNYESFDHALNSAVQLLEEYEVKNEHELSIVRGMVREAAKSMERGDYREYTKENLHELFDDVKRRGRLRAKQRKERERREILGEAVGE